MKTLKYTQVLYIKNDLKSRKTASGFRDELLDHMCTSVEEKLNDGLHFSKAYELSIEEFTEQGFLDLQTQSPVVKKKRKILASQFGGATVAALIFMMVFGVDAQEPPKINPLSNDAIVTSSFGFRTNPLTGKKHHHRGIDFKCNIGTPVKATAGGVVLSVTDTPGGYGKKIEIQHDENHITRYAHLGEIKVTEGQKVKLGEVIALSGNSGWSTAPHLHYEVMKDGDPVDPSEYLAKIEE